MAPPKVAQVPAGFTQQFLQNPLLFMRSHSMSPPNDSGWKDDLGNATRPTRSPPLPPRSPYAFPPSAAQAAAAKAKAAIEKAKQPDMGVQRRTGAGGIRYAQIVNHTSPNFAGATTLKFLPENDTRVGSWLPVYWLPWKSLKILQYQIPGVPQSLAEWDDEDYPRFFFTAGINGCSIFAQGDPQSPTISHAGIDGDLDRPAGEFWRSQMAKTKSGYGTSAIKGEVNAHMYARSSASAQKAAEEYRKFLSSNDTKPFNIEVQSPFGCVFGIRYGRAWTLYLQKSVLYNKISFHKEGEVETKEVHGVERTYLKGTTTSAKVEPSKATVVPKKFGPFTTGTKESKVYSTSSYYSMPLQIMEMYPNTNYVADLKDLFKLG